MNDKLTELTHYDIDNFVKKMMNGEFDPKSRTCMKCGADHFANYGGHIQECDECYFDRFPKEQVKKFYRSFF